MDILIRGSKTPVVTLHLLANYTHILIQNEFLVNLSLENYTVYLTGMLGSCHFSSWWLQRGSMFVISQPQFRKLCKIDDKWKANALLDLGAGDGEVTAHIAPLFSKVYATEMSNTMRTLLQRRGYQLLDIESWYLERRYDVISCLNLIDRCDTPLELFNQIRNAVKPNGKVLLAVVLPFSAYVESGSPDHKPKEILPINGSCFEEQVRSIVDDVLTPANFEVESWSRVPYLCEGDLQQSYYWLDDAIFVLKLKSS